MDDKELAEKVAEKLDGWDDQKIDFDWPTFGLMVEKAGSMGWLLEMEGEPCCQGPEEYTLYFDQPTEHINTEDYSIEEHGHIKACALAFIEIPTD